MASSMIWAVVLLAGSICVSSQQILGTPVTIEEYPSLAQVEIRLGLLWVQQCAASVLTSYHVLSAASCFYGDLYLPENRRIRVGSSYRYEDGYLVTIEYARNNPNFGLLGADGDLSVVRLSHALALSVTVQQVAILGQGIHLPDGLSMKHVGWGTTAEGGATSSAQLYSVDLFVYNNDRCLELYQVLEEPQIITENMICAGVTYNGGRDFDSRDIGAPIFFDNVLVGVMSFGEHDSNDEIPVVSTLVGSYTDWIIETAVY